MSPHALARDKLQGVFEGSLGYTDNVQGTPDNPPPEAELPAASGDAMAILSPGIVYTIESASEIQRLAYTYTAQLYAEQWASNGYSNRLEWEGFFLPSRYVDVALSANATQSHHHTAATLTNASATALNAAFPGTSPFLLTRLNEAVNYRPWHRWSLRESIGAGLQTPIFPGIRAPTTFETNARLGAERRFRYDSLGLEGGADYTHISGAFARDGEPIGNQAQLVSSIVARWRHDWGRYVTSQVDAGALNAYRITANADFWHPTGLALLTFTRREGNAQLSFRHGARTDLFLGLTFLTDEVLLRGAIPVDEDGDIVVAASGGRQSNRLIDENGELATNVDVWLLDVGVNWRVRESLRLGVRYQHIEQDSGAELPPLPLTFVRNSVMATAAFEYPPEERTPRAYRPPLRVDGQDSPFGGERQRRPGTTP